MATLYLDVKVNVGKSKSEIQTLGKEGEKTQKKVAKIGTSSSFTKLVTNAEKAYKAFSKTTGAATKLLQKINEAGGVDFFAKQTTQAKALLRLEKDINDEIELQAKYRAKILRESGGNSTVERGLVNKLNALKKETESIRKVAYAREDAEKKAIALQKERERAAKAFAKTQRKLDSQSADWRKRKAREVAKLEKAKEREVQALMKKRKAIFSAIGLGAIAGGVAGLTAGLISGLGAGISRLTRSLTDLGRRAAQSFYQTNVQLEQMQILMNTAEGSIKGGAAAFQNILDFATKAPFSVQSLSDSFVKLRTAGLQPMDGTLQTLVDSVAAFGGSSEQLRLVSIAVQQMVGKGVISMEELRRQFGEQVPTAMRAMAEGLQMSILDMFDLISEGGLEAGRGIEAMLGVLKEWHGGAAQKRMDSMQGAVALMRTEWSKLMITVADSNDLWKNAIRLIKQISQAILTFSKSEYGKEVIDSLTDKLNELLDKFKPEYVGAFLSALAKGFELAASAASLAVGIIIEGLKVAYEMYKRFKGHESGREVVRNYDPYKLPRAAVPQTVAVKLAPEIETDPLDNQINTVIDKFEMFTEQMKMNMNDFGEIDFNLGFVDEIAESFDNVDFSSKMIAQAKNLADNLESILLTRYEKLKEETKQLASDLAAKSAEILKTTLDFDAEIAALQPTQNIGAREEWENSLAAIEQYKAAAQQAWATGDIEKYKVYLEKVTGMVRALSTEGVRKPMDEQEFKRREESLKKQIIYWTQLKDEQRSTQGRYTYTRKIQEAQRALAKLKSEEKKGGKEIISAEEQRIVKLKLITEMKNAHISLEMKEAAEIEKKLKAKEAEIQFIKDTETAIKNTRQAIEEMKRAEDSASQQAIRNLQRQIDLLQQRNSLISGGTPSWNPSNDADNIPGRYAGGPVTKGSPYVVGERGPELFVPKNSGQIIPNNELGDTLIIDFRMPDGKTNSVTATRESAMKFYRDSERYNRRRS